MGMNTISHLRSARALALLLVMALLTACGVGSRSDLRDNTLYQYAGAIRWGHVDDAWTLVDPEYASRNPLTPLERERFEQIQVTSYQVKGAQQMSEQEFAQVVEIRIVNRHTLVERVIEDRQLWRWDAQAKRWWLTTGLPRLAN